VKFGLCLVKSNKLCYICNKKKELPMKVKYICWFLLGLLVLAGSFSCQSQPPADSPVEEKTPETTPEVNPDDAQPNQASLDALNAAASRAAKARQLASDFNGPAAFPSDWQAAESLYTKAESGKNTSTVKNVRESTARYNAAADAFDSLAEKSIAQYARDLEAEGRAARNAAINAGAETLAPSYLQIADNTALEADAQYGSKDYYEARDSALLARDSYIALKTGIDAYTVRQEIEDRGFMGYDSQNIATADAAGLSGIAEYEARNVAAAQDKADEALFRYNLALRTAKEAFATEKGAAAAAERQKAVDLKANVAVRQDFEAAQSIYNQANSSFRAKNFDSAAELYAESHSMYEVISRVAGEKRRVAEEALRAADEKMLESDNIAKDAELILEGGSQ
jgi:hypothetical protein